MIKRVSDIGSGVAWNSGTLCSISSVSMGSWIGTNFSETQGRRFSFRVTWNVFLPDNWSTS